MYKLILFIPLIASCTMMPSHEYRAIEYCRQRAYDTVCPGYEPPPPMYHQGCSVYDYRCRFGN